MITIDFQNRGKLGLSEYLYITIKKQIQQGILKGNEKLPSKRTLAQHLGISVITVQNAYNLLIDEGYLYSYEKKGFFVTELKPSELKKENLPLKNKNLEPADFSNAEARKKWFYDFTDNSTGVEKFPFRLWSRITKDVLNSAEQKLLSRIDFAGVFELRDAIAKYLQEFRNMEVNANQVVIGAGTEVLFSMLVQFLGINKTYAVENPGYRKVAAVIESLGSKCVGIDIDKNGMNLQKLKESKAQIAHISPNHHFPTGTVMPVLRRQEFLDWAKAEKDRYIIEDDYDSEFRFNGKPLSTLQSADTSSKVIYINTFSKTLSPSFRIGFMILPPSLVQPFRKKMGFFSSTVSAFEQYTLAKFISSGYYGKHITRMKNYYRSLRNNFINAIECSPLAKNCTIHEEDSGLHFLLKIKTELKATELKERFASAGLKIPLLSEYFYTSSKDQNEKEPVFIINYSGISKNKIEEIVQKMCSVM